MNRECNCPDLFFKGHLKNCQYPSQDNQSLNRKLGSTWFGSDGRPYLSVRVHHQIGYGNYKYQDVNLLIATGAEQTSLNYDILRKLELCPFDQDDMPIYDLTPKSGIWVEVFGSNLPAGKVRSLLCRPSLGPAFGYHDNPEHGVLGMDIISQIGKDGGSFVIAPAQKSIDIGVRDRTGMYYSESYHD